MDLYVFGELTAIGLVGGVMAGFLGIGGGVVIIPLLLYGAGLTMQIATGVSMVQAFFATLSGLVVHRRNRTIDHRLGAVLGLAGVVGGLLGALLSARLTNQALLMLYLALVAVSLVLMFLAPRAEAPKNRPTSLWLSIPIGLGVGVLAGMLGVGGGFIMIPLMISALRIPTRIAVGTSLVVIVLTTLAGTIGKIAAGLFDLQLAAFVILGSIVGAQVGGRLNARVSPRVIRLSLTVLLVAILIRTGLDLFVL
jgi:uncharacterized membrane protein YfcA